MTKQPASRKLFYLLTAGLTLFCSEVSANASAQDVHELGDICMYSQRILKDYALVGMGVTYHDPKKDLDENIKTVDKYFKDIEGHKLDGKLMAELTEVEKSWNEIKPEFEKAPDKANMGKLHERVEKFTSRCEQVADELADDTGIKGEHYVELVAELGMDSQQMAALYMMKAWGAVNPDSDKDVVQVSDETEKIYHELLAADDKLVSKEIKDKLKANENDVISFSVMVKSTSGRFMPSQAEKSATKIFDAVREILAMEEKLVEAVSSYFTPVADENKVLDNITGIVRSKEEQEA